MTDQPDAGSQPTTRAALRAARSNPRPRAVSAQSAPGARRAPRSRQSAPERPPRTRPHGRAGRNLPAAVAVGVGLGLVVVAGLFIRREVFVAVVAVAVSLALWELTAALAERHIAVPFVPVVVGAWAMAIAAYTAGGQALAVCFVLTGVGIVLWRAAEGAEDALRDVAGGVFAAAYLPLLAGFVPLMLAEPNGAWRVLTFVVVTVSSDIGGYALGVVAGRRPMAPSVSPKKSWEGFGGSAIGCVLAAGLLVPLALKGPWWGGLLLGLIVVSLATLGDLAESMIKRDLGIKDMGSVLPGHGGVMDRLDSLVLTAPAVWLVLHVLLSDVSK